ncbi:MAG: RagB/SusD family nutrient uptake outer membrane protein [Bacteroidales bacterium]|nr:RagB/SusD family nutrient uptake outer membrane protein [Bacteroidales bacterium]
MKNGKILFAILSLALCITACDKFLDEMPDNRAEVDSPAKIRAILTSAYPNNTYLTFNEYMSDNVDNIGDDNPGTTRFVDQCYNWADITEVANDCPAYFWSDSYSAIAHANQAIIAIRKLSGLDEDAPLDDDAVAAIVHANLSAELAEALLCRAYNHFMLVNEFCLNYNATTSGDDLGIPYMESAETQLNPKYERGTVKDVYEKLEKDLELGLKYVDDKYYKVPKYHFNVKAAYAFATRYYLFSEQWQKAIDAATVCLGSQPAQMLRNWEQVSKLEKSMDVRSNNFIDTSHNSNLLLLTAYTTFGRYFGMPGITKYTHDSYLSFTEVAYAQQVWGNTQTGWRNVYEWYWVGPEWYSGSSFDQIAYWKIPFLFEYTDPVAQIGYAHAVYPCLSMEETLLSRAEAYAILGQYDAAAADITTYIHSIIKAQFFSGSLTPERIQAFYSALNYATWDKPTVKKKLNPAFDIGPDGGMKECMLQCVLGMKRIDHIAQGLRWFDVKRYGIEIWRRTMAVNSVAQQYDPGYIPNRLDDVLKVDDPRRAMQLPPDVISAGLTPNPRNE